MKLRATGRSAIAMRNSVMQPLLFVVFIAIIGAVISGPLHADESIDHDPTAEAGHADPVHGESSDHDEADLDSHVDEADEHGHEDGLFVEVSDSGLSMAGIRIHPVSERMLSQIVEMPGEIGFDEDRLAHITPRYSGVVKRVFKRLGEHAEQGDLLAVIESNQSLTSYEIRAPLGGRIVEKHAIPGEYVTEDISIFVIADLSTIWVNLDVYPRHLEFVSKGVPVSVKAVSIEQRADGVVSYVAPLFDRAKRAAMARVALPNKEEIWRPGMFVRAEMEVQLPHPVPAVEREAVQTLEGETHLFVPDDENRFRPIRVALGRQGRDHVEVISGITVGDRYVAQGAFELKAQMITGLLGAHAGHGH